MFRVVIHIVCMGGVKSCSVSVGLYHSCRVFFFLLYLTHIFYCILLTLNHRITAIRFAIGTMDIFKRLADWNYLLAYIDS